MVFLYVAIQQCAIVLFIIFTKCLTHFADSSKILAANKSLLLPLPSNLVNSTTVTYNEQDNLTCEREQRGIIILAGACGGLIVCVILTYVVCIVEIRRLRKRRRRSARCVRGIDHWPPTRNHVLQLSSNFGRRASPILKENPQSSSSRFEITTNPSYSVTTVMTPSSSTEPPHQYDDVMNFPRKEEGPSEEYDRLDPSDLCSSVGQDGQGEEGGNWSCTGQQCTKTHRGTPSPTFPRRPPKQSKPPPKSPPKPPKKVYPTPTPRVHVASSLDHLFPSQLLSSATTRKEYRLSAVSDGYVNEFDGPPSVNTACSGLHPSPSLQYNPTPLVSCTWRRGNCRQGPPQDYETPRQ